jgi:hypothetical protein
MTILFDNLLEFYARDARRERSVESDFGVQWVGMGRAPRYRVSFIHDTGEVYGLRQEAGGAVILIAIGLPKGDEGLRLVEKLLRGWADICGTPFSLGWVGDKLFDYMPEVVAD